MQPTHPNGRGPRNARLLSLRIGPAEPVTVLRDPRPRHQRHHRRRAEHIDTLAQRYLGSPYPWYGGRDQTRLLLTIAAESVQTMG